MVRVCVRVCVCVCGGVGGGGGGGGCTLYINDMATHNGRVRCTKAAHHRDSISPGEAGGLSDGRTGDNSSVVSKNFMLVLVCGMHGCRFHTSHYQTPSAMWVYMCVCVCVRVGHMIP